MDGRRQVGNISADVLVGTSVKVHADQEAFISNKGNKTLVSCVREECHLVSLKDPVNKDAVKSSSNIGPYHEDK